MTVARLSPARSARNARTSRSVGGTPTVSKYTRRKNAASPTMGARAMLSGAIGAAGTGYNVAITGYGRNGTGTACTGCSLSTRCAAARASVAELLFGAVAR